MTYTYTDGTLTVQSDNLTDFTGYETVTLFTKRNCTGTEHSVVIEEGDITDGDEYVVNNQELIDTEDFTGGVWSLKLTVLKEDGTKIIEEACLFVDTIHCDVAEAVMNKRNVELQLDYYLLARASEDYACCDCEALCNIYKRLANELGSCTGC
jgi:hypothetical protein